MTSTATKDQVLRELNILSAGITALEQQWKQLRDDPRRTSRDIPVEAQYLAALHKWYTVQMPATKAALRVRIDSFWDIGPGEAWRTMLAGLDEPARIALVSEIRECDARHAGLRARCEAACEVWDQLVQLEVEGNNHVYFAGESSAHLRRT